MAQQITDTVNFKILRYANCWEDAGILCEALEVKQGSKILSIASAGDNSLSLLLKQPKLLVAVDVNEVQLFLLELKKVCFECLSHAETVEFLGFTPSTRRKALFNQIKSKLQPKTLEYWESHTDQIESGVIHQGKFEKYFAFFCRRILPFIHSKRTIEELFERKSDKEQKTFYQQKWNTWRWRLLFKVFFSKRVMGKYGRDPEFLKQVKVNVSDYIYKRAELQLKDVNAFDNIILRYNLTAGFDNLLPHYLWPQHYESIKQNIGALVVMRGYAEDAIQQHGSFDAMNLSNIFEYLDPQTFTTVAEKLVQGLSPEGKMAYWNLMVPRRISELFPRELHWNKEQSERLGERDMGFFYNRFVIETKK